MHDFNKSKPTPLSYDSVPIIDISALASNNSEQERLNLAQVFENVYTNIGFAYIVNHGISQQEIDDIFQQARLFHALLIFTVLINGQKKNYYQNLERF